MSFYSCKSGGTGGGGNPNFPIGEGKIGCTMTPNGYDTDQYNIDDSNHQISIGTGNLIKGPYYSLWLDTSKIPYSKIKIGASSGQSFYLVFREFDESTNQWTDVVPQQWVNANSSSDYDLPQDKIVQISMTNTNGTSNITWSLH